MSVSRNYLWIHRDRLHEQWADEPQLDGYYDCVSENHSIGAFLPDIVGFKIWRRPNYLDTRKKGLSLYNSTDQYN